MELKHCISFTKGYIPSVDGLLLPDDASPDTQEVEFYKGLLRPARGFSLFTSGSIANTPLTLYQFTKTDGGSYFVLATSAALFYYSAGTWTSIGVYTGTDPRHVSMTVWPGTDQLLISDYENEVKKWNGTTYAALGGLTNIKARYIRTFYAHVLLGNTIESGTACPHRMRWSSVGAYENWTTGTSGFFDLADTPGFLKRVEYLRDRLFAYKEDSIWEIAYVGYPRIFTPVKVISDTGLLATDTVVEIGGFHYYMGTDNIYRFNGVSNEPIGNQIWMELFGPNRLLNDSQVSKCKAVYVPVLNEYWLAVPTIGSTDAKTIYRYNITTQSWWSRKSDNPVYCFGSWKEATSITWDDLVGTWLEQDWVWGGSAIVSDFPIILVGSSTGATKYIKKIDVTKVSTDLSSKYWDTIDKTFERENRFLLFWVEAEGSGSIELFFSDNGGHSYTALGTVTGSLNIWKWLKWSFNITRHQIRFRLRLEGNISVRRYMYGYKGRKV